MKPKVVVTIAAVIGIATTIALLGLDFEDRKSNNVFHVTLADPVMYENGVFTDSFEIERGSYQFSFVPNGDSPQTLTISLLGPYHFSMERFVLKSDLQDTGISEYYIWRYVSGEESTIEIPISQTVQITIDPHENYNGAVSVFLKRVP